MVAVISAQNDKFLKFYSCQLESKFYPYSVLSASDVTT